MQITLCNKNVNDSNEFRKLARVMKNDLDYLTKRDVILKCYINYTGVCKISEFVCEKNICHLLIYISIFLFIYQTTETGMIVS